MNIILHLLDKFRQQPFLQIFTIYLRYLIGGAFVIASIGMGKFSGEELLISQPGAPIETLLPLQQFFRVMATSGLYWQFIGWSQIISGALLMTQRYAKLGAIVFFGIILNIFIITVSYDFQGTPFVTGLMLLAATFLVLWDFESFQFMFRDPVKENLPSFPPLSIIGHPYWSWVGVVMLITIITLALTKYNIVIQLATAFGEGLFCFLIYVFALRKRMR